MSMLRQWIEEWARQCAALQARKQALAELQAEVEAAYQEVVLLRPWWRRFIGRDHMKRRA